MADPRSDADRHWMILQQLRQGVPGGIYPDKFIPGGGPPMVPPQGGPTPERPMPPAQPQPQRPTDPGMKRQGAMADVIRTGEYRSDEDRKLDRATRDYRENLLRQARIRESKAMLMNLFNPPAKLPSDEPPPKKYVPIIGVRG